MPTSQAERHMPISKAQDILVAHLTELVSQVIPSKDRSFYYPDTERLDVYRQIADIVNTYNLPEKSVDLLVENMAVYESQIRSRTLLNHFYHDHGLQALAGQNRDKIRDNFDNVVTLFPQTPALLQKRWDFKSALEQKNPFGHLTDTNHVDLGFLLLTRYLNSDHEEREAEAEFFLHDFFVLGSPIGVSIFTDREDQIRIAVQEVIKEWNVPQERVTCIAQTVMDKLFQGGYGKNWWLWHLKDIYDRVEMVVTPSELHWEQVTQVELLRAFQESYTHLKKEDLTDQLAVANAVATFAQLDTQQIAHDALRMVGTTYDEDGLLRKLHVINAFVPTANRLQIMRSMLQTDWKNRKQKYITPEHRATLYRVAKEIGFDELVSRIEAEGFDEKVIKHLYGRTNLQNLRRHEKQEAVRLETAKDTLRKGQD